MTREPADAAAIPADDGGATGGRPDVIVEILFDRGLLSIAVRNIGTRPAIDVSVRFDDRLVGLGGLRDVGAQAVFRRMAFLGPGREVATLLDSASSYFASGQPTGVVAHVEYGNGAGTRYTRTIRHDLEIYRDLVCPSTGRPSGDATRVGDAGRRR